MLTAKNCNSCGVFTYNIDNYSNYYIIANAGNLYWFADQINNKGAKINAIISPDSIYHRLTINLNPFSTINSDGTYTGEAPLEWVPIGTIDHPFTGVFLGNRSTLNNMYLTATSSNQGLFGVVSGETASISDFTLTEYITVKNTSAVSNISVYRIC